MSTKCAGLATRLKLDGFLDIVKAMPSERPFTIAEVKGDSTYSSQHIAAALKKCDLIRRERSGYWRTTNEHARLMRCLNGEPEARRIKENTPKYAAQCLEILKRGPATTAAIIKEIGAERPGITPSLRYLARRKQIKFVRSGPDSRWEMCETAP
ncbi:MAG TPA: hypothetical protein VN455_14795 [Methanotrichaceae archaeon]|nr:hypothetical protein [Methanotrichaceae archaeon]